MRHLLPLVSLLTACTAANPDYAPATSGQAIADLTSAADLAFADVAAADFSVEEPDLQAVPDLASRPDLVDAAVAMPDLAAPDLALVEDLTVLSDLVVAPDLRFTCPAGLANCDGDWNNGCEVDTRSSANHCGSCGTSCSPSHATPACVGGACAIGSCNGGHADCDGKYTNGCETDTTSDPFNCGGCGDSCAWPNIVPHCANSRCDGPCVTGFADCDGNARVNGCEVNLNTDAANCGRCGAACSTRHVTAACSAAGGVPRCDGACEAGYDDCDGDKRGNGCETNLQVNATHCGACGHPCLPGENCVGGMCK